MLLHIFAADNRRLRFFEWNSFCPNFLFHRTFSSSIYSYSNIVNYFKFGEDSNAMTSSKRPGLSLNIGRFYDIPRVSLIL